MPSVQPIIDALASQAGIAILVLLVCLGGTSFLIVWLIKALLRSNHDAVALGMKIAEASASIKAGLDSNTMATMEQTRAVATVASNVESQSQRIGDAISQCAAQRRR